MKYCKICKKELKKTYYYRMPKVFCSNKCKFISRKTGLSMVKRICECCSKEFMVQKGWGKGKFCSSNCVSAYYKGEKSPRWKGGLPNCEVCKKRLSVLKVKRCLKHAVELNKYKISGENHYNWQSKKRNLNGENNPMYGKHLTPEHKAKISGENNARWKGGITPLNQKVRGSFEYQSWRKQVFERDNYICQICGVSGGRLRANHIKKFCDYPELRFNLLNGITICRDCDYRWVFFREWEWESYFNFNLMTRGVSN